MKLLRKFIVPAVVAALAACSPPSNPQCITGESRACVGVGGCSGGQVCLADGTFGVCDCGNAHDGGTDVVVDVATDTATDIGVDAMEDAGNDASDAGDGGTTCDPVGNTGCPSTQRCTWSHASGSLGVASCQPNGTVALGGNCAIDDATGIDNCQRGATCQAGQCMAACHPDANDCDATHVCLSSGGTEMPFGYCEGRCDPVTQERLSDHAAACGSTDPVHPDRGCYLLGDAFICARAGDAANVSDVVPTTMYANSCAPGFAPLLLESTGSTRAMCVAFCRPAPTDMSTPQNAGGVPGSGYTCADRGAGGSHECHYFWALQQTPDATTGNAFGYCIEPSRYQIDQGGTPMPYPSCTTLNTTDAQMYGCQPLP